MKDNTEFKFSRYCSPPDRTTYAAPTEHLPSSQQWERAPLKRLGSNATPCCCINYERSMGPRLGFPLTANRGPVVDNICGANAPHSATLLGLSACQRVSVCRLVLCSRPWELGMRTPVSPMVLSQYRARDASLIYGSQQYRLIGHLIFHKVRIKFEIPSARGSLCILIASVADKMFVDCAQPGLRLCLGF